MSCSVGCSLSGTGCFNLNPPQGHHSCQQSCSSWALLFTILQSPARSLLQHGLPTGSHPFWGVSTCSRGGSSRDAGGSLQGHRSLSKGCRGISTLLPKSPPPHSLSLTLLLTYMYVCVCMCARACITLSGVISVQ